MTRVVAVHPRGRAFAGQLFDAFGHGSGCEVFGTVDGGDFAKEELGNGFVIAGGVAAELVVELDMSSESLERIFVSGRAEVSDADGQVCAVGPKCERESTRFELCDERPHVLFVVQRRFDLVDLSLGCGVVGPDRSDVEFGSAICRSLGGCCGFGENPHESPFF